MVETAVERNPLRDEPHHQGVIKTELFQDFRVNQFEAHQDGHQDAAHLIATLRPVDDHLYLRLRPIVRLNVPVQLKEYHEEKDLPRHVDHHRRITKDIHRHDKQEPTIENLHVVQTEKRRRTEIDLRNVRVVLHHPNVPHLQEVLAIVNLNVIQVTSSYKRKHIWLSVKHKEQKSRAEEQKSRIRTCHTMVEVVQEVEDTVEEDSTMVTLHLMPITTLKIKVRMAHHHMAKAWEAGLVMALMGMLMKHP